MAIVSCNIKRSSSADWSLDNGVVKHEYTKEYVVVSNNVNDDEAVILSTPALPKLGDPYFTSEGVLDPFAYVTRVSASRDGESLSWKATIQYGPHDPAFNNVDPIENKPKVNWGFVQFEDNLWVDRDGKPCINTAYDWFDPGLTRFQSTPALRIERNEATFNYLWAWQLIDTVNSETFAGADPECVRCSSISADLQIHPQLGRYWTVQYEFQFDRRTWTKKVFSQGYRALDSDGMGGLIRRNILIDGVPASQTGTPVFLDADGHAIPPGPDLPSSAVVQEFKVYDAIDFAIFGFSNLDLGLGENS